jgi:glycosyltransferase involved in cell wall biosynthesis
LTAVHQFLPTLAGKDAIGRHCLLLQRVLREAGIESEIYARDAHDDVAHLAHDVAMLAPGAAPGAAWALYHFSIGDPITERVQGLGWPIALDYHNITEPRYFLRWEPVVARRLAAGRQQLAAIRSETRFAVADSTFNESDLVTLGFRPTAVAPILIDFSQYDAPADAAVLAARQRRRERRGTDWLYVGRLAPNKCQHDVVAAFAAYRRLFDPAARLTLVGGQSAGRYTEALHRLCVDLGVERAVTFTDLVDDAAVRACYRSADVFVCLSEHEGFNVPILESMHFGVPVVALATTAVPETAGPAAVLLDDNDPLLVACTVDEVLSAPGVRERLLAAGRARVEALDYRVTGPRMVETLTRMIACTA